MNVRRTLSLLLETALAAFSGATRSDEGEILVGTDRRLAIVTTGGGGAVENTELALVSDLPAVRRVPPDANDLAVWTLDETTGDFVNTGVAGYPAGNLVPSGTITRGVAGVFDGATLVLYLDGALVGSLARALTIAYTQGPNDVWAIGANAAVPVFESRLQGRVDDVRIANVARPASWFREVFQRGVGWYSAR